MFQGKTTLERVLMNFCLSCIFQYEDGLAYHELNEEKLLYLHFRCNHTFMGYNACASRRCSQNKVDDCHNETLKILRMFQMLRSRFF